MRQTLRSTRVRTALGVSVLSLGLIALPVVAVRADLPESQDPLGDVALDMHSVVKKLTKLNTGKPTQETQKEVVAKLDKLIEELEKQCANCQGGQKGPNPSKPLQDSIIKNGPGGSGKLHASRDDGKNWGELPPHERDRILQSMTDGFPAHYQGILERYYKRLAEEKTVEEAKAEAAAAKTKGKAAKPASEE
jgi:hypothetical protein